MKARSTHKVQIINPTHALKQAAKEERLSHVRAAWTLSVALARVLLEDAAL